MSEEGDFGELPSQILIGLSQIYNTQTTITTSLERYIADFHTNQDHGNSFPVKLVVSHFADISTANL